MSSPELIKIDARTNFHSILVAAVPYLLIVSRSHINTLNQRINYLARHVVDCQRHLSFKGQIKRDRGFWIKRIWKVLT